ncbi:MAG: exodeoxyribonuclease VII small subunit [Bacteroidetes bacterium]|nr:exodeoxyribonuclease VII small subunit [Rhodothermaceae bacterium RA]RMH67168.1 MAG: exodeoxyribonuclease VII small subunit [Bacteroidota bacterium]
MSDTPHAADTPPPPSFEHALARLEALVDTLEHDETTLEEALHAYEEGVALARFCLERLNAAELRVQELRLEEDD